MRAARIILAIALFATCAVAQGATFRYVWQWPATSEPLYLYALSVPRVGTMLRMRMPPTEVGGYPKTWLGVKHRFLLFGSLGTPVSLWSAFPAGCGVAGEGELFIVPAAGISVPTQQPDPNRSELLTSSHFLRWWVDYEIEIPNAPECAGTQFAVQVLSFYENPEGLDVTSVSNAILYRIGY